MDLEALHQFVDVTRLGSFAAVARARGVAPSSVSRAVGGLEEELGVRLFHRTTRRMSLTEAGERFFALVEPAAAQLEEARELSRAAVAGPRGEVRITAPITFAELNLMPLVPALSAEYPELRFHWLLTDRMVDLVDERVDLAVRLGRLRESSLIAVPLCEMVFCAAASPAYLDRRGRPETPRDLEAHNCLRYPVPGYRAGWWFRRPGVRAFAVEVNGNQLVSSSHALRSLALADQGIMLMPRWNVARELADGRLEQVLPEWECTSTTFDVGVSLVYPSRAHLPRKVRVVADFLREVFRAGPPAEQGLDLG